MSPVLPPQRLEDIGKPTLVLDLDGTLIATSRKEGSEMADFVVHYGGEKQLPWRVRKRFGLNIFLEEMAKSYELVVFSMAERPYVEKVVNQLDPDGRLIAHYLSREDCSGSICVKDVKDLNNPNFGRDLRRVVWLDDYKDSFRNNLDIGLVVPQALFSKAYEDNVLLDLIPHLQAVANGQDVRASIAALSFPLLVGSNFAKTVSRPFYSRVVKA